jgi:glutathione synthase/RimK-type ligase-like ATP-grasp enzyme
MKNVYVYPHDMKSEGAKALSDFLGVKRIKHEGSKFRGNENKKVINWGNSSIKNFEVGKCSVLNDPFVVRTCADKLEFFKAVKEAFRTPAYTTEKEQVVKWLEEGAEVCARKVLRGSGADGLVLFSGLDEFVEAPLYTRYVKKKEEFRVHVVGNKIIDVQRKAIKKDLPEDFKVNVKIRNLDNGYIFMRNDIVVPDDVKEQALKAMETTGLDFGAVDVIWNEKKQEAYVLEINTAPGLQGTTVELYGNALKEHFL